MSVRLIATERWPLATFTLSRVRDVADMVAKLTGAEVQRIANPRQEDAENELAAPWAPMLLNLICS